MVATPQPAYAKTPDGTHIAYLVMGDGPVDLVYAFGYQSCIDADGDVPFHAAFRERLASSFRLILFDRRGTGLSDRTGLEGPGALELGMDDMLSVMDAAETERPLVFGVSDGTLLASLFAASHPDRVSGLILWGLYARGRCRSGADLGLRRVRGTGDAHRRSQHAYGRPNARARRQDVSSCRKSGLRPGELPDPAGFGHPVCAAGDPGADDRPRFG
jgi:pimeloyl-ACP methyl ester carboxylesterase